VDTELAGDFVRQLQLAKQLEQKAKEAARGRETAEERIEEATALLAKVKGMSAFSAETEKLITLANQSYSEKDYREALSYAVKSVEASVRARKERLQEMLDEARSLLDRVSSLGSSEKETDLAIKKASDALGSGELDEAFEMAKDAWDAAERNANRVLSDAFGRAQSSLLFAEGLGLKVEKQKSALRNCRDALESGDVGRSVELINTLSEALRSVLLDRFIERAARLERLLSLEKGFPLQLRDAHERKDSGRDLISHGRVEEAFAALEEAEDAFSRNFGKAAGKRMDELARRARNVSRWKEVDLGDLEGEARRLEREERYSEAVTLLDSARDRVREAEKEVLLRFMAAMQPRLRLAHMTMKDVSPALQRMEEARKALRSDDLNRAFALAEEARQVVEERLQGYDRVEEELQKAQSLRSRCADLELACPEGGKAMVAARKLTMKGDYDQAVEALRSSQRSYRLSLENHFATAIMRLEMKLASAMRLDAEVAEESAALENLTAKVRKGDFELVHGSLITIAEAVEDKTSKAVSQELGKAEAVVSRYPSCPDVDRARESLAEAGERFRSNEFQAARDIAISAIGELMSKRRESLDHSLKEGRIMLDMAKQLGAESVTLRDRLKRGEELRASGRMDDATLLADEVCSYGRSIVTTEIDQQLTDLMQRSANARQAGVEVSAPERLAEDASNALHHGEIAQSFDLTMAARRSLQETMVLYRSLKERLEEWEALMEDARRGGHDVLEATDAVARARALLGSGKYGETREQLDAAEGALKVNAPAFLLRYHLKRMSRLGDLLGKLGHEGSELELKRGGPYRAEELETSLSKLSALRWEWEEKAAASLGKDMSRCKRELDKASVSGNAVGHVKQILARAASSLEEGKLFDAMSALELVRSELDETVQRDRNLADALSHLEEASEQLGEMKAPAGDVTVLLEQARALRREGDLPAAYDSAKRGLQRSQTIARERMAALTSFAGGLTEERSSWEDLRTARKLAEDIEEALKNYRYRHAMLLARSFREELERVLQDRGLAEEELRNYEARLKEEAKAGLRPPTCQRALEKAKAHMAQGRFVQVLSAVSAARDELRSVSEMYESRLSELNELRETLNSLEVLDARKDHVEELLDRSWSSLKDMKFDSASLYLRRARNGLHEFMTLRMNELLWEFGPLHDLIKRLKLHDRFSAEINDITGLVVDGATPRDLNRLSRSVDLVKAGLGDMFQEQRERVRRIIEKASRAGKETGRSWEVWADSESRAKRGDLWEAFSSLESAVSFIGQRAGQAPEQLSRQLSESLKRAKDMDVELPGTEKAYAVALMAEKDGKRAELMGKALETLQQEVRSMYPRVTADVELAGEVREGRPLDVKLCLRNDSGHGARSVRAFVFGDVEVKGMVEAGSLGPGEEVRGRITVIPNRAGIMSLGITVKCKPLLTDEDVLYDSKIDLDVK